MISFLTSHECSSLRIFSSSSRELSLSCSIPIRRAWETTLSASSSVFATSNASLSSDRPFTRLTQSLTSPKSSPNPLRVMTEPCRSPAPFSTNSLSWQSILSYISFQSSSSVLSWGASIREVFSFSATASSVATTMVLPMHDLGDCAPINLVGDGLRLRRRRLAFSSILAETSRRYIAAASTCAWSRSCASFLFTPMSFFTWLEIDASAASRSFNSSRIDSTSRVSLSCCSYSSFAAASEVFVISTLSKCAVSSFMVCRSCSWRSLRRTFSTWTSETRCLDCSSSTCNFSHIWECSSITI
mmetsp:Transcript_25435/g.41011  ORF Transcript_25435/g.41011 Transcript_25435/m.41011 type:complete len:300 (-) Transcript_25435:2331-3230(-)